MKYIETETGCDDHCCPGWVPNFDYDSIERCDSCAVFETDNDAAEFVAKTESREVVTWVICETIQLILEDADPKRDLCNVFQEHRAAAGEARLRCLHNSK